VSAPIAVGDEAWALIQSAPTLSTRRTVLGAALLRIEAIESDGTYVGSVVRGSGVPEGPGYRHRFQRAELYARRDRDERLAFKVACCRIWGPENIRPA
jgi:hypothetical protein